ncbi:MAG: 1-(5-phosphoribosyl)-5-[(5-phosphoribosylamino)methylideneamino]imidazole-4-carboxamide isomerase [Deltaproteobacteria bacterium]|nr:1-(5-phosphoribosyl)-5-[(5-phosphoribosylamino)methylideneamino]imidazole-4-carboxamide isomerase [Deltaproteobacteria bacterium]
MIVIPAIDLKNGRCVRLKQGRMSDETVYSEFPEEAALKWHREGAERIHIVDLDGAVQGRPVNGKTIRKIVDSVPVPIELGGGIRDMDTIKAYLDLGISQVILGTIAYKDPELVSDACRQFPGRIILGIDASKGLVAVEGWIEKTDITPVDMAKRYESAGIWAIIYTDIQRDGMISGPNIDATRELAEATSIPVIASGGISGKEDVKNLLMLEQFGVIGMITGKALYEGTMSLNEAIKITKSQENFS